MKLSKSSIFGISILAVGVIVFWVSIFIPIFTDSPFKQTGPSLEKQARRSPWRDVNNAELVAIGRVLVKNNIHGCGEYYIKQSADSPEMFYVKCGNSDTDFWHYYTVNLDAEMVYPASDGLVSEIR